MIEQLFGSKTRVKLLQLFYQNPNRSFYVREITRKIDEQINSVRRELANLLSIGIITSENTNNRLYYEVNQDFEHYPAMASMFGGKALKVASKKSTKKTKLDTADTSEEIEQEKIVTQTTQDPFAEELQKTGNVHLLVYTGQFTRDETTGVDIVIVGDVNNSQVEHLVSELEKTEKKELRYSIFSQSEFEYRKDVNDRFYANLKQAKKIVLVDKDKLLS
jgi:hypothetical protein